MKKILLAVLALILLAAGVGWYQWNKPHRSVDDEKGLAVNAVTLFQEFSTNEAEANRKYLNKAVEVSGVIATIDQNQDKQRYLVLQSDDALNGIMCTMRDSNWTAKTGDQVTVKGFCSGFISDVKLTDCVLSTASK
jgi:hypothetical protein